MFLIHDVAGRYWDGARFNNYHQYGAKRISKRSEAEKIASNLNAQVQEIDHAIKPIVRLYDLLSVHNNGAKTALTTVPFTHDECCVMKSKLTVYPHRTIVISETEYKTLMVEDLTGGIALIWLAATLAGIPVMLKTLANKKVIFLSENGCASVIFNPIEDDDQLKQVLNGFDYNAYPDDAVMPKVTHTPNKEEPHYFFRQYGETISIAALKCFVKSMVKQEFVRVPIWLVEAVKTDDCRYGIYNVCSEEWWNDGSDTPITFETEAEATEYLVSESKKLNIVDSEGYVKAYL